MVKRKKVSMFLVVLLSTFMLCSITTFATESNIPDATEQFYINDFADIIDDATEEEMQERAVELADSTEGAQVVVSTVQTIGEADPVYYTVDMYNKYGIGKNNIGVLIMLSVETGDIQIRIGDNMTKYLSDKKCGEIRDIGIPYFKEGQFAEGLNEMQKATIEQITEKVETVNNEVAVTPADIDSINTKGHLKMFLAVIAVIAGGVGSFFGINKYSKKRKEQKAAEEREKIRNLQLVQKKEEEIRRLEAKLANAENYKEAIINERDQIADKLKSANKEINNMSERNKRAVMAYPDINEKVDAIFAKEKEEADKQKALAVESKIKEAIKLECTRNNLYNFRSAYEAFKSLSHEQQKYVPENLVNKVKKLYDESTNLQRKYEEEERIKKDKEKAAKVQKLIIAALAVSVTRHSLSNLRNVCNEYERLTAEQKRYVTADVESLYAMQKRAKRLEEEYEEECRRKKQEEERRRRQREEEERRRRAYSQSSFSSTSHSSFGGHSGFGGHSSGHGAGGKF